MKKLFISFTATMNHLVEGSLTRADLDNGLFVFGCTRKHAMQPGVDEEYVERSVRENPAVHEQLVAALVQAEDEGRVRWRGREEPSSFALVNALLAANNCGQLMSHEEAFGKDTPFGSGYNYDSVAARAANLDLVVVF